MPQSQHRCKRYRVTPAGNRGWGLVCCTGLTQWKDLEAEIDGWSWVWSCPKCGGELRRDPWNPPSDMPKLDSLTSTDALEAPSRGSQIGSRRFYPLSRGNTGVASIRTH